MSTRHYALPECLTECLGMGQPGYIEAGVMLNPEISHQTKRIREIADRLHLDMVDYCQHCLDFAHDHATLRLMGKELLIYQIATENKVRHPRSHQYLEKKMGRVIPMKQPGIFTFPANPYTISGLKLSTLLYARYFFAAEPIVDDPADEDTEAEELRTNHNDHVVYQVATNLVYWASSYFRTAHPGHFYLYDHVTRKCSTERYPVHK